MINDFFTTLYTISRSVWTTDESDNAYSEEAEIGMFNGHIQQTSAEKMLALGLTLTNSFTIWCPLNTDIKEGDTLTSVDGVYSVRSVQIFAIGGNKHLEVVVQKDGEIIGS